MSDATSVIGERPDRDLHEQFHMLAERGVDGFPHEEDEARHGAGAGEDRCHLVQRRCERVPDTRPTWSKMIGDTM